MPKPLSSDDELHHELAREAGAFANECERLIRTGAGRLHPPAKPLEPDDDTDALEREAFGSKP